MLVMTFEQVEKDNNMKGRYMNEGKGNRNVSKVQKWVKNRQHPDFPGGHPPEYYPSLKLLNFTERTGYGVFSLRWPSTLECVLHNHPPLSS